MAKKKYINVFQVYSKERPDGSVVQYARPNFHPKYGIKSIKVLTNDDEILEFDGSSTLFSNVVDDKRKELIIGGITRYLDEGKMTEEKANKRIEQVNNLRSDLTLVLDNE